MSMHPACTHHGDTHHGEWAGTLHLQSFTSMKNVMKSVLSVGPFVSTMSFKLSDL